MFGDLSDVSLYGEVTPARELEEALLDSCGLAPIREPKEPAGSTQQGPETRQSGRQSSRAQHGGTGDEESPLSASPGSNGSNRSNSSGSGPWLRVSGNAELMELFRKQLQRQMPGTRVFEAAHIEEGGSLVHRMTCPRVDPAARASYILCPCAAEIKDSDDRLVAGRDGKLHSNLHCMELKDLMGGRLLRWCPTCTFDEASGPAEDASLVLGSTEEY